jgi:Flp pilus assembly protein TadG
MKIRPTVKKARRLRGSRGGALLEAAIVLPFVISLLFGIIDYGSVFNDWIAVRQGGRDALRQALTNTNPSASASCSAHGTIPTGDATTMMCFTKDRVGLDASKTYVKFFFTTPYTIGNPVKVCVLYQTSSLSGAYGSILNGRFLTTQVESLIEQSQSSFVPFEETLPAGKSYPSSCNSLT